MVTSDGMDMVSLQNYRGQLQQAAFFLEDEVYWPPASSKKALYDQLSRKKYREILRQQIRSVGQCCLLFRSPGLSLTK